MKILWKDFYLVIYSQTHTCVFVNENLGWSSKSVAASLRLVKHIFGINSRKRFASRLRPWHCSVIAFILLFFLWFHSPKKVAFRNLAPPCGPISYFCFSLIVQATRDKGTFQGVLISLQLDYLSLCPKQVSQWFFYHYHMFNTL